MGVIEWLTANAAWISAIASLLSALAAVFTAAIALRAMSTWQRQVQMQDRFQKVDSILNSYVQCLRAGHDWQWSLGTGAVREVLKENVEKQRWLDALMQYRKDWILARHIFESTPEDAPSFSPEMVQNKIIKIGKELHAPLSTAFHEQMQVLLEEGVLEISNYR